MLQVKITEFDGSDAIILERAKSLTVFEAVNSSDEGVSFNIAKNDPKAYIVNPDQEGYKKFWEVWDTVTNERVNYGPITSITEQGTDFRVEGAGRSALLLDFYKTTKTFYTPIDSIIDDIRYENLAVQPRTTTLVHKADDTAAQDTIFGATDINEKYAGLSLQTKDNVIDDNSGLVRPGEIEPPNTYHSTDSFWAGQGKVDSHIIDLGDVYSVSKLLLILPSWGGSERKGNRTYDFELAYATDTEATLTSFNGREIGPFHALYDTGAESHLLMGNRPGGSFYIGAGNMNVGLDDPTFYVATEVPGTSLDMRYIRTRIYDVHAWYGSVLDQSPAVDKWRFQCDPTYEPGDEVTTPADAPGVMEGKVINERELEPANDCFASIIELGVYKEILGRGDLKPLALQRIDNNNLQIIYSHQPEASETVTTPQGFRKFEPGGFFRAVSVNYSGASSTYSKFYDDDCADCYPDNFNFGVMDQNNSLILSRDQSSGTGVTVKSGAYTSYILMKGASNAVVTHADSWPAVTDPLSWGGSYSYTKIVGDYAILHFRGQSLRWYATLPDGETPAEVSIEIRNKDTNGEWTGWTTLESSFTLPTGSYNAEPVYEISYESGALQPETVYQIKITNLDGNYLAIDSFEGYWSSSMTSYNEDNSRIGVSAPERLSQIYDRRFSGGSMYKWNNNTFFNFVFEGDRIVLYSAKGRNHGKIRIILRKSGQGSYFYDDYPTDTTVLIPGGNPTDGSLSIDLETGKRGAEIPQFVAFDSNDYFPDGLPWSKYLFGIYLLPSEIDTYTTTDVAASNNFIERCSDCEAPIGEPVTIAKHVYFDGLATHEKVGLSISFENEAHLDILKAVAEATQTEWDINEAGVNLVPRLGEDTNEVLREGQNTMVDWQIVNDVNKVATQLVSSGADIDGLPLFTITEDKKTRADVGRTIMRKEDFRNIADYFQLIGLSRVALRKRRRPEKRITVTHITKRFALNKGDSFILYTNKMGPLRVRIMKKERSQAAQSGFEYRLECIQWPQIT
jgi:hypothetical protein